MKTSPAPYTSSGHYKGSLSSLQLHKLLEPLSIFVFAADLDGNLVYVNENSEHLLGYQSIELIGKPLLHIIHKDDQEQIELFLRQVIRGSAVKNFEARLLRKDGNSYPASWTAKWDAADELFYGAIQDITEQRNAVEELWISNERFRLAAKSNAIYDWNIPTDEIIWGEGLFDLLGYHPHELQMKHWEKLLHPDEQQSVIQSLNTTIDDVTATSWRAEYQMLKKDNSYCFIFEQGHIVRDEKGKAVRIVGSMHDVSDRKRAEAERMEYEQRIETQNRQLGNVLEQMIQGFFTLDKEFRITHWNKNAEDSFSVTKERILGEYIGALYNEDAQNFYRPMLQKVILEQRPLHSEHICPQNGKWTELSIYPSDEGVSVFFKDIEDRKQSEVELDKLSLIARQTDNLVIITDASGNITWVNEAFTRVSGFTLPEVAGGRPGYFLQGPDSDPKVVKYMRERIARGEPFTAEILNYTKTKEKYWVEIQCRPVKDANGKLVQFFAIQTVITERKKFEAERQAQQKRINAAVIEAQEKERAQVGQELHDNVNQVLTTVKLYTELCRDGIGNTSEIMNKSIKLLQTSIDEIRSLSKRLSAPSLGNIKLKESVKELVDAVAATGRLSLYLNSSGIDGLEVAHEVHLCIYRLLQEHLTNVLKHAAAKEVYILLRIHNGELLLQVNDDGKGFDTNQKRKGIGITNMITRTEAMRGRLTIHSSPGEGCQLVVCLPTS